MGCDNKDWLRLDRDNGRQVMEVIHYNTRDVTIVLRAVGRLWGHIFLQVQRIITITHV
jgi:hypothetical protein